MRASTSSCPRRSRGVDMTGRLTHLSERGPEPGPLLELGRPADTWNQDMDGVHHPSDRGNVTHVSEVVCPQCSNECDQAHKFCPVCGFPIAEFTRKSHDPLIGTNLPGGYVILELVGVGGMGRVYRAEQKALGRTVAVKIIHPHLLGDESASVRFITE